MTGPMEDAGLFDGLRRHWGVLREVWAERRGLDPVMRRKPHEIEFLPAALEIQESPPSPLGRAILWTLVAFFLLALLWATLGRVDIIAVARGKIIPSDRVKLIQPLESGVIRAIHVEEGQSVAAGEPLIDLDPTDSDADRERLKKEYHAALLESARLRALLRTLEGIEESPELRLAGGEAIDPARVAVQRVLLLRLMEEYRARLATLGSERDRAEAEIATLDRQLQQQRETLPLLERRVAALKRLAGDKMVAEHTFLELEEQRISRRHELGVLENRLGEARAARSESEHRLEAYRAEFQRDLLARLTEAQRNVGSLHEEYTKAKRRAGLQRLTAPVDGVVQQLAVHTVGGVVTPAQELMRVVPGEAALEVEAWVENKDIGFVHEGQAAEVKIDAFPFTKYGLIDAELVKLSDDAIPDETLGLVYAARVRLERTEMTIDGKRVRLSPGMSVAVEVKTGQRRLIEYFLAPLLRARQESVRER